jgi:PAS domain S-box-containing protein
MDAIVELDDARRITHANSAAGQLFACSDAELLERCFDALLTERGRDKLLRVIEEVDRRPGAQRSLWIAGGLAARRTDGQEFPAEATLSAYDLQGRRYHTLILRDVNDRLEAERRIRHLEEQTAYLREEITTLRQFDQILGTSPALLSLLKEVDQVSPANTTVLIVGETGTGKELIARAIHEGSRRRAKSLIKVNCAAIPSNLMESELFGHEKGAFTGATQQRAGRFALADGGTMFLDEIGELPLDLQSKLLRVLQEGEFEPVGSSHTRKADVRIIAATNRDLQNEVASGRFREDLFYRLNVFPIRVPPLRERGDDVTLLAGEFAQRFARELGRSIEPLDAVAQTRLRSYAWPGNIRELQNVIERAVITARSGRLDLDRALPELARLDARSLRAAPAHAERGPVHTARQMRELERANILSALDASQWRVSGAHGAAAKLGMKPSTLSSRMKALGIRRPRAGE